MTAATISFLWAEAERPVGGQGAGRRWQEAGDPDLWMYRERTTALLRRYLRFSLETGRLPSLLGQQFFRAKVSGYNLVTFEERVIFVHDVESSLHRLDELSQQLIVRVVLQEYSHEETARLLHCCRKTVQRKLPEAMDRLSELFLAAGLLLPLPSNGQEACQEGERAPSPASCCRNGA